MRKLQLPDRDHVSSLHHEEEAIEDPVTVRIDSLCSPDDRCSLCLWAGKLDWRLCRTGGWLLWTHSQGQMHSSGRTERLDAADSWNLSWRGIQPPRIRAFLKDYAGLGQGFYLLLLAADGTVTHRSRQQLLLAADILPSPWHSFFSVSVAADCGFDLAEEELEAADASPGRQSCHRLGTQDGTFVFSSMNRQAIRARH